MAILPPSKTILPNDDEIIRPKQKNFLSVVDGDEFIFKTILPNGIEGEVTIRGSTIIQIIKERCIVEIEKESIEQQDINEVQVGDGMGNIPHNSELIVDGETLLNIARRNKK